MLQRVFAVCKLVLAVSVQCQVSHTGRFLLVCVVDWLTRRRVFIVELSLGRSVPPSRHQLTDGENWSVHSNTLRTTGDTVKLPCGRKTSACIMSRFRAGWSEICFDLAGKNVERTVFITILCVEFLLTSCCLFQTTTTKQASSSSRGCSASCSSFSLFLCTNSTAIF